MGDLDRRHASARTTSATPRVDTVEDAARLLARRPLTRAELEARLRARGHPDDRIGAALVELEARGYVDDDALARHYVEVRAARKEHGPERLVRELRSRGIDPDTARRAVAAVEGAGEVDFESVLRRAAERRIVRLAGRRDRAAYARVYNGLLRAGFEPASVRDALAPHFPEPIDPVGDAERDQEDTHDL